MTRVAVVGGGVIGLCSAIALVHRGADVIVFDAGGERTGASAWNCGWLAPSHCHPLPSPEALRRSLRWLRAKDAPLSIAADPRLGRWLLRFALASRRGAHERGRSALAGVMRDALPAWGRMEAAGVAIPWATEGPLAVFTEQASLEAMARHLDEVAAMGLAEPRILDAAAARALVPSLSSSVVGAIEHGGERSLDPRDLIDALRATIATLGADQRDERVVDVAVHGGRNIVSSVSGTDEVDRVVLAAGAWSATIARRLGLRLPVTSGRGYVVDVPTSTTAPARLLQLVDAGMVVAPLGDRIRLCGTMELASPKAPLDRGRVRSMMAAPARYLDAWHASATPGQVMATPRPMSPDGLPMIGPLARAPGVIVATGHGMLGVTLGAVTGELVAELAIEGRAHVPEAFRPSRFRW